MHRCTISWPRWANGTPRSAAIGLSDLVLTTSALLQGKMPNQRGAWDMDTKLMVEQWQTMERGLKRMAEFVRTEGIFDDRRLPTNAVLAPIAALYAEKFPSLAISGAKTNCW